MRRMIDHVAVLHARLALLKAETAPPEDRARLLGTARIVARAVEACGGQPPGP